MIFLQDLKQQNISEIKNIDLLHVINYSGLKLERIGSKYEALCPFHKDKLTKSFRVYPTTNSWACFSANCLNPNDSSKRNGGGVIEFVKQFYHLNFTQACDWLKENFGDNYLITPVEETRKEISHLPYTNISYFHNLLNLYPENKQWFYDRGFTDYTINNEMFGWDGDNHVIPIWEYEPRLSKPLAVKLRTHKGKNKYIKLGSYKPWLYGISNCKRKDLIYGFAGELDAALANQHGLGGFSVVDGAMSFNEVPDWPLLFDAKKLIVVFDKKEGVAGSLMAKEWQKYKGKFTAKTFLWPSFDGDDFTDFVKEFGINKFLELTKGLL